jgi:hypothetical protein
MEKLKKTWAVRLNEPSTGHISWSDDDNPVSLYFQLFSRDDCSFEIVFRDGKWADIPQLTGGPSLADAIRAGDPYVVELVGLAEGFPEAFFGAAGQPRFSEEILTEVRNRVTNEPDRVKAAAELARLAHKGQVDKAGRDYIDHPRRVFENVSQIPGFSTMSAQSQEDMQVAAWLHDVLEDSGDNEFGQVLPCDLAEWGFTANQVWICSDLNKHPTWLEEKMDLETYFDWINQTVEGRLVKIADSADNNNLSRIEAVNALREVPFDQASNMATRAALELNPEEEAWFEASIATVIS